MCVYRAPLGGGRGKEEPLSAIAMVLRSAGRRRLTASRSRATRFFIFAVPHALAAASLRMSTGEASRDDDATTSSSEITLCATQTAPLPRHRHPAACTHAPPACVSDPPLGKFPPWSFQHPVLVGASARWRAGGGSAGLIALLKCEPISPRQPPAARRLAHSRHVAPGTAKTSRPFGRSCASRA